MTESACRGRGVWYQSYAHFIPFSPFCLLLLFCLGCDLLPLPGDTDGVQNQARWVTGGRLVADTAPRLTIVRLRFDTAPGPPGPEAPRARFDLPPTRAPRRPLPLP